ncbi:MAG: 4-carboxy-4-hydroxy-2-oxoadipate aldolase/oxaloacetate decarboxylase [Candidatus Eremiobacteraeota bacterium]|nr:4-carboxy-4-hydroxy-2-oxoadipate aldolase/oxaloacetate decarboxylase [Candidatus Eremiobacteraeota bacterium]
MIDYAAFRRLGVSTVYEATGKQGLIGCEFRQLTPGSRAAGPARTVRCGQDDNLMVHAAIERIEPGDVVVLTMPEPRPVALIGELLLTQMMVRKAAAVLCDAASRDVEELATMGLPVWTRFVSPRGATKEKVGALDVPVEVGGATINPGDIVVLDADGACVVAHGDAQRALQLSEERFGREERTRERYRSGERSYDINDLRRIVEGAKA